MCKNFSYKKRNKIDKINKKIEKLTNKKII